MNNKLSLIGEVPKGSAYSTGLQSQVPPTRAVSIGVFVKDTNGYVAATGMDIFFLVDNTSSNQVRIALKQRLFPSITQVDAQNIVKVLSNVTDLTGDGVINQDDVHLLLSLIGPRFAVPSN